jgi:hypothetical protein
VGSRRCCLADTSEWYVILLTVVVDELKYSSPLINSAIRHDPESFPSIPHPHKLHTR